jgi:hypothetical protein
VRVKLFLKKFLGTQKFLKKNLTLTVPCGTLSTIMNKKWIPRSQRWTESERQEKKLQSKNARELRIMFWRESQAFRLQIEKEISEKVLARREALG